MLQRIPIALAQVKAGHTPKNLLNEIRQIIYSLYRSKEITKKVHKNIILSQKIELTRKGKYIALSNLSICYTWKNIKKSYKNNKLKISAPTWNEEL